MDSGGDVVYFVDTNSLRLLAKKFDDPVRDRPFWEALAGFVLAGRLKAPAPVVAEARKQSRVLAAWMDGLEDFAAETSELWDEARELTRTFPFLAGSDPGDDADPWLIALAQHHMRTTGMFDPPCVVVTQELGRKRAERTTRIPEVCRALGLECIDIWQLFEREGWGIGIVPRPTITEPEAKSARG